MVDDPPMGNHGSAPVLPDKKIKQVEFEGPYNDVFLFQNEFSIRQTKPTDDDKKTNFHHFTLDVPNLYISYCILIVFILFIIILNLFKITFVTHGGHGSSDRLKLPMGQRNICTLLGVIVVSSLLIVFSQ